MKRHYCAGGILLTVLAVTTLAAEKAPAKGNRPGPNIIFIREHIGTV